ncbi:MAG: hypothetical protein AVDCRST_MAG25-3200, partial [uncultured Rubrobacteraceae bacterium]
GQGDVQGEFEGRGAGATAGEPGDRRGFRTRRLRLVDRQERLRRVGLRLRPGRGGAPSGRPRPERGPGRVRVPALVERRTSQDPDPDPPGL